MPVAGVDVRCSITTNSSHDFDYLQRWESAGAGRYSQLAGTRVFDIASGATVTYKLFCDHSGAGASSIVSDSVLSAIFTPAP